VLLHDKEGNYRLGYIELLYQGRRNPRPLGRSVLVRKEAPNKTARQENLEDGGPNPQGRQRLRREG